MRGPAWGTLVYARRFALVIAIGVSSLAFFLGLGLPRLVEVRIFYPKVAYWALCGAALWLVLALDAVGWRGKALAALRERRWQALTPALVGLALMAMIFIAVDTEYRVLTDETNLLGTALSMYLKGRAEIVTGGLFLNDTLRIVSTDVPSRPNFYPFLVSLLHMLLGWRAANGFVVNFMAGAVSLAALFVLARRLAGTAAGYLSCLLLAATPLFCLTATSSGFETLNLAMFLLCLLALDDFLQAPSGPRLELMLCLGLLLSQCRYESVLLLPFLLAAGLWHGRVLLQGPLSPRLLLFPLLMVPCVWQRLITSVVNMLGGPPERSVLFSPVYLPANLRHAAELLVNAGDAQLPTSTAMAVLAAIGVAVGVVRLRGGRKLTAERRWLAVSAGAALAGALLTQCLFYLGNLLLDIQMRMALIYCWAIALFAGYALAQAWRYPRLRVALAAGVVSLTFRGLAVAQENLIGRDNAGYEEYKWALAIVKTLPREGTLIINDRSGQYTAQQYGSLTFGYVNLFINVIANNFETKVLPNILVIQRVWADGQLVKGQDLNPRLSLSPIVEYTLAPEYRMRVSRVVAVDSGP